jgi:hypothetical protein
MGRATFGTLIRLLAVTGMRVGEAIRLDRSNPRTRRTPFGQAPWELSLTHAQPPAWTGYSGGVSAAMLAQTVWPASHHPLASVCGPTTFAETAAENSSGSVARRSASGPSALVGPDETGGRHSYQA